MAHVLSNEKRLEVLGCLVNGSGIRAASRMTGAHQDTIGRFGFAVGVGCERLHDRLARDLTCSLVDMDEQHSWCSKRQQNVDPKRDDLSVVGEQWTWVAICRSTKLVIAWTVGKRDQAHADLLVEDVRARLLVMPQITTDGLKLYEHAVAINFGPAAPYVQTVKNFSERPSRTATGEKFAPKRGVDFIQKRIISGAAGVNLDKATTYAAERSNLTNRVWNARLIRRTLCFSKLFDRHCAAVALMFTYRALCHIQRNMRETAAMAAGITDRVWSLEELMVAALAEPAGEKPRAKPLTIPKPEGNARELPGNRGWLRAVPAGGSGPAPSPGPAEPPPGAPAVVAAVEPSADPTGQLDLLAWRPKAKPLPPKGTQLKLFDE